MEAYFENARAITSLALAQTFQNLTNIRWHIPHGGDAWPSIEDRLLNYYPDIKASAKPVFNTRCWYDNAGAVFPDQVKGLLGYGVPPSQLVFGTVSTQKLLLIASRIVSVAPCSLNGGCHCWSLPWPPFSNAVPLRRTTLICRRPFMQPLSTGLCLLARLTHKKRWISSTRMSKPCTMALSRELDVWTWACIRTLGK